MKFEEIRHIHFIGIGGIGMSALARLFLHEGKGVSGSDITMNANTLKLEEEGVEFFSDQGAHNIVDGIDLVIYTEAMEAEHPELVAAREKSIKTINYFEALGMIVNEYYLIAVAGTHGKTTTTAMLADILEEAGFDPSVIVGSLRSKTGSNYRAGKSKYMIVEACEYKRDFLHLEPDVLVITNLEHEHVDYYKDLADVQDAFRTLAEKVPEDGALIVNLSDPNVTPVISKDSPKEVVDYTKFVDPFLKLKHPGLHNQMNAAAATATANYLGVQPPSLQNSLEKFAGTWRRFEYKGECNGAKVYDDYAHHPTEIAATISGVRELYPEKKITVVFQPHLHSRTEEFFDNFVNELSKADRILLAPIYEARKEQKSSVSIEKLAEVIHTINKNVTVHASFNEITELLKKEITDNDVVMVMGAGDITKVAVVLTNN